MSHIAHQQYQQTQMIYTAAATGSLSSLIGAFIKALCPNGIRGWFGTHTAWFIKKETPLPST